MVAVDPYTGTVLGSWERRNGLYDLADTIHGTLERLLVRTRGLAEAAQLAHELERRVPDLGLGRRGLEVVELADVAAHGTTVGQPTLR